MHTVTAMALAGAWSRLQGESVSDRKRHAFCANTTPPCLSPVSQCRGETAFSLPSQTRTHEAKQAIQTGQHKQGDAHMQPHMLLFFFFFYKNKMTSESAAGLGPRLLGDTAGGRVVPQSTKASFMWRSLGPGDYFWVCVSGNENVRWQRDSSERKSSAQLVYALDIYGTFSLRRSLSRTPRE